MESGSTTGESEPKSGWKIDRLSCVIVSYAERNVVANTSRRFNVCRSFRLGIKFTPPASVRVAWIFSWKFNMLKLRHIPEIYSNITDSAELVHHGEQSLELADILPIKARSYDKNRAPKMLGQPTVVYFHVTVLSIDSINEESMTYVTDIFLAQRFACHTLCFCSMQSIYSLSIIKAGETLD